MAVVEQEEAYKVRIIEGGKEKMTANEDLLEKRYWNNGSLCKYFKLIESKMLTAEGD